MRPMKPQADRRVESARCCGRNPAGLQPVVTCLPCDSKSARHDYETGMAKCAIGPPRLRIRLRIGAIMRFNGADRW